MRVSLFSRLARAARFHRGALRDREDPRDRRRRTPGRCRDAACRSQARGRRLRTGPARRSGPRGRSPGVPGVCPRSRATLRRLHECGRRRARAGERPGNQRNGCPGGRRECARRRGASVVCQHGLRLRWGWRDPLSRGGPDPAALELCPVEARGRAGRGGSLPGKPSHREDRLALRTGEGFRRLGAGTSPARRRSSADRGSDRVSHQRAGARVSDADCSWNKDAAVSFTS